MQRNLILSLAGVLCCATSTFAASYIYTGQSNYLLASGLTDIIEVYISGPPGNVFQGVDLTMTMNDGVSGPLITAVDMQVADDLLFHGVSNQQQVLPLPDHVMYASVLTTNSSITVGPNGLLARVTVSMVGVAPGWYPFTLTYLGQETSIAGLEGDGMVGVYSGGYIGCPDCPEPPSLVLAGMGAASACLMAVRRRRQATR